MAEKGCFANDDDDDDDDDNNKNNNIVKFSGYLIPSDHQLYRFTPLKTAFGLLLL
jgi:hypothetical protein